MNERPNILCSEKYQHTHARRHFDSLSLFLPAAASPSNGSQPPVIQPPCHPPTGRYHGIPLQDPPMRKELFTVGSEY